MYREPGACVDETFPCKAVFFRSHAAVEVDSLDMMAAEVVYLVLHKGDERGYDKREGVEGKARDLEDDRFTTPGRHQSEGIAAVEDGSYYVFL